MAWRTGWLTPPTKAVFLISIILAIVAVLAWLGILRLGVINSHLFETLLIAYVILALGNLVRGI